MPGTAAQAIAATEYRVREFPRPALREERGVKIRDEQLQDIAAIRTVVRQAFATMKFSRQTEPAIVDALRAAGAMTLSLVAEEAG